MNSMKSENDIIDILFEKVRATGDEEAYRMLFEELYAPLCLFANKMVSDFIAEDIVQELFVYVWEKRNEIVIENSVRSYLLRSMRNRCLNFIKHQSIRDKYYNDIEHSPQACSDADELLTMNELRDGLVSVLEQLPEEYRNAFVMSHSKHMRSKEIAERLGVTERTVERYKHKAIKMMRAKLKDYFPLHAILIAGNFLYG